MSRAAGIFTIDEIEFDVTYDYTPERAGLRHLDPPEPEELVVLSATRLTKSNWWTKPTDDDIYNAVLESCRNEGY